MNQLQLAYDKVNEAFINWSNLNRTAQDDNYQNEAANARADIAWDEFEAIEAEIGKGQAMALEAAPLAPAVPSGWLRRDDDALTAADYGIHFMPQG